MSQRFRIVSLLILFLLAFAFMVVSPRYFHPAKDFSLESREFHHLKEQANKGSRDACETLGVIYHYNEKYAEAVKYWECSINKNSVKNSQGIGHLAGYHFHGYGVDVDSAKGAMYLILGENITWPRGKRKKLRQWLGKTRYTDLLYIDNIEKKFEEGAQLTKVYIINNNITDPRLTEDMIAESLKTRLANLKWAELITSIYLFIFFLGSVILIICFLIGKQREQENQSS